MGYNGSCFNNRQLAVNLFYTVLVLFSGKSFAREAKRRVKLNDLTVSQVAPEYRIQTMANNRVTDFFATQENKNTILQMRQELEQKQLKDEANRSWKTTNIENTANQEMEDELIVIKKVEKMALKPFSLELKASSKKLTSKKEEEKEKKIPEGYLIKSSRHQNHEKSDESTPFNVKVKFRPEQGRGKIALEKGSLRMEADYKIGGKREVASIHTLSSLGVTTKVAYNVMNKQTVTSVDKKLTEHVSTRVTQTSGINPDQKAEVIYSLSF